MMNLKTIFGIIISAYLLSSCYRWKTDPSRMKSSDTDHVVIYSNEKYYGKIPQYSYQTTIWVDTLENVIIKKESVKYNIRGAYTYPVKNKQWVLINGKLILTNQNNLR